MKTFIVVALTLLGLGSTSILRAQDKKPDVEVIPEKNPPANEAVRSIVGLYRIQSGEQAGQAIPRERLTDVTVRITEQTITTYEGDSKQRFSATYRLDSSKTPWHLHMTSTPETKAKTSQAGDRKGDAAEDPAPAVKIPETIGLIDVQKNKLRIIYALPGGQSPSEFKAEKNQHLFVLVKIDGAPSSSK